MSLQRLMVSVRMVSLHFDIVYSFHHPVLCFLFLCLKKVIQGSCSHTDSKQNAEYPESLYFYSSPNIQDHPPPDTSGDHPDIF